MSTCTHPKGSTKAVRKQLAKQQPRRFTFFREFDFCHARHCHRIATMSLDLALLNGNRSRKDRQKDLGDYLKAKAEYKKRLVKIASDRIFYQANSIWSNWRPIGGDSRRTEL